MVRRELTSPFLDSLREAIRVRHYSIRTEKAYAGWARRFILFHNKRHPKDMGGVEVAAFLSHLALELEVSPRHRIRRLMRSLSWTKAVYSERFVGRLVRRTLKSPPAVILFGIRSLRIFLSGAWIFAPFRSSSGMLIFVRRRFIRTY
jgi:hypothetical protein